MLLALTLFAVLAASDLARARAVDRGSTWLLPEEGFPVFYRYFRDQITWYEADAVCQFHHADLVTVDSAAQYDAVRAYLKELDVTRSVWIGLASARGGTGSHFTWTDYRRLTGEGWWRTPPPPAPAAGAAPAPRCAAAEPAHDYRWTARGCGGPDVASFVCELPVPSWARGTRGCLVRALPALTAVYLPDRAAVQLTTDCGLAGVKKYMCTADEKHENILEDLSCGEVDERESSHAASADHVLPAPILSAPASITSFSTATQGKGVLALLAAVVSGTPKRESTDELPSISKITTSHQLATRRHLPAKAAIYSQTLNRSITLEPKPFLIELSTKEYQTGDRNQALSKILDKLNTFASQEGKLEHTISKNNYHNNEILKVLSVKDLQTNRLTENAEQEVNEQSKILHDEVARHGNLETIFTQPTDHFIPPLIIAKAKMSNDMKVLSLDEKQAQKSTDNRSSAIPFGWPPNKEAQISTDALIQLNRNFNLGVSVNFQHSAQTGASSDTSPPFPIISNGAKINMSLANKSLISYFPKKYQPIQFNHKKKDKHLDPLDPKTYYIEDVYFKKKIISNLRTIKSKPSRPNNIDLTTISGATENVKLTTAAIANTSARPFIVAGKTLPLATTDPDISTLTYAVVDITPTVFAADGSTNIATDTDISSRTVSVIDTLTPKTEASGFIISSNYNTNTLKNTTTTESSLSTATSVDNGGHLYDGLKSRVFSEHWKIPDSSAISTPHFTSTTKTDINVTSSDKRRKVLVDSRKITNFFKYNAMPPQSMSSGSISALAVGNYSLISTETFESVSTAAYIDRDSITSPETTTGTITALATRMAAVDENSELTSSTADKQGEPFLEPVELEVEIVRGDADAGDKLVRSTLLSGAGEEEEVRPARSRRLQLDRPRRKFNPFRILG